MNKMNFHSDLFAVFPLVGEEEEEWEINLARLP